MPAELERILNKALEKDRNLRYQSAADLRTDLARLKRDFDSGRSAGVTAVESSASGSSASVPVSGSNSRSQTKWIAVVGAIILITGATTAFVFLRAKSSAQKITSLAVLPFVNATPDANNEYLSDGLTESLISTLSQLPDLKVMARSTVFKFKGKEDDPRQIGQTLEVGAVLMGRITQHGDEMAVQADLVSTADGSELWGSHYETKAADITQIQGEITRDISGRLHRTDPGTASSKLGSAGTSNPEAYRLYLEARQLWYGRSEAGIKKSIDLFQQAITADPNYALAYAGLADVYNVAPSYISIPSKQAELLADEYARKALQLDNTLPEAHSALAMALADEWKWSEADAEFRRAIELNPNSATSRYFYAIACLSPQNRIPEGLEQYRAALSLDPLSSIVNSNYALMLMQARRYDEALAQLRKVLARDPNFGPAHYKLSQLYSNTGHFPEAVTELSQVIVKPIPVSGDAKGYLKLMYLLDGSDQAASVGMAAALAGDRDLAFEYLGKAYANGDNQLMFAVRFPALDSLHSDPRFKELLSKMGLQE